MRPVELLPVASELGRERFIARYEGFFLLLRPLSDADADAPIVIPFETLQLPKSTRDIETEIDPSASEWGLVRLEKRPGNPFPDRLTIGRAKNSDVVLRTPFVSKLHALVIIGTDPWTIMDHGSANGTVLNGTVLEVKQKAPIKPGDRISFGALHSHFIDAGGLFDLIAGIGGA